MPVLRQVLINLQWRPSSGFAAMISFPVPCGLDGAGSGARDLQPVLVVGGRGPNCNLYSLVRVLFAMCKDLVHIAVCLEVLLVLCNPPLD